MRVNKTLVLCLFLVASLAAAHAGDVVFNTDFGGSWAYGGTGSNFSATAVGGAGGINIDGGPFIGLPNLTIHVVTGNTTITSPGLALFSSTGSSFTITDASFGTIFTGSLTNLSLNFAAAGATGPIFNATFIAGVYNPLFLAAFGLPPTLDATGKSTFNLLGNFDGLSPAEGVVNGSVTDLAQVPEPASLLLFSSGLFATGTFLRRKLTH